MYHEKGKHCVINHGEKLVKFGSFPGLAEMQRLIQILSSAIYLLLKQMQVFFNLVLKYFRAHMGQDRTGKNFNIRLFIF